VEDGGVAGVVQEVAEEGGPGGEEGAVPQHHPVPAHHLHVSKLAGQRLKLSTAMFS